MNIPVESGQWSHRNGGTPFYPLAHMKVHIKRWPLAALAVGLVWTGCVHAGDLLLGNADTISLDQPLVTIRLEDPNTLEQPGPNLYDTAILDTGANGLLLAAGAYADGEQYGVETRADTSTVHYTESGVAGTQVFDVLKPYNFYYAGSDGVPYDVPNARAFGSSAVDLGDIAAIVGMPAMTGRVINMDFRPLSNIDLMTTEFATARPAAGPDTYHVNLHMLPPEWPGVDPAHPDDPKPTFAALPIIDNVQHVTHGSTYSANLLLDTGAQTSVMSTTTALNLGLNLDPDDPNTDILDIDGNGIIDAGDYLEVSGIGGAALMPFIHLDQIKIPTQEGTNLVFNNVEMGVLDIEGIDGVLGMNILTSGYLDLVFGDGGPNQYGAFLGASADFTDPALGVLQLDVNPNVPEPASATLLLLMTALALPRRRRSAYN
jgi:hypothetical protein